jgi:hypothetical protein
MEMLGADWVEPVGAESLIQLYFSNPALLGVRHADEAVIDVLGAPGELDAFGALVQGLGSTWNFPVADFTGAPFFASDADVVVFQYNGVQIPIHEAHLEATIAPDGNSIDGGRLSGLGDTRKLGELVGSSIDNYDALCGLAAGLGVDCVACPDGEAYCLPLKANDIHGERIEGLVLNPVFD